MRPYSEAVKADVRRRMSPPHRQRVTEIAQELGIHVITLYKWRKAWRLQGEMVPPSHKDPEGWGPADKFTVVLEAAGLNATEQVDPWRQAAQDANAQPLLTMAEQKDLEKRHQADQREIKRLQQELRRKEKAPAEAAALLIASKKIQSYLGEDEGA
jgi:transposase-like protein